MIARDEGRLSDALSMLKDAHGIWRNLGNLVGTVAGLGRFASVLALAGRAETAAQLLSCSESLREEIGHRASWLGEMNDKTLVAIRTQLDNAAVAEAWEQGRALTPDEAVALALGEVEHDA